MWPATGTNSPPRSAGTLTRARHKLPWPEDRDFRILSIDGGGIRGILPLAILARMEGACLNGDPVARYFDMVVGTSTGGIIALGLGAEKSASELLSLYLNEGQQVFPTYPRAVQRALGWWQILFNRCRRGPLDRLILKCLGDKSLWQSRVRLCIPTAEMQHCEPFIFKTPHHPDYRLDWRRPMAEAARATSAAPTFFRSVQGEGGYEFVDGGIWANNPIMIGIADALACYQLRNDQIRVLSLGCVEDVRKMTWLKRYLGGQWYWREVMLDSMHVESQNVLGQARLIIGHDRVLRLNASPVSVPIELWNWDRASKELPALGEALFETARDRLENEFVGARSEPYSPFYTPGDREEAC